VIADDPAAVMERFAEAGDVIARGETKCSVRLQNGMQADLRVVPSESLGAALQYFTGSKAHNVSVRSLAQKKRLTVNEYGVFKLKADGSAGKKVAGETEEEVYEALGLPWIPPELREDRGEIEAALAGSLPSLVDLGDLRGDLHMHTTATDVTTTVEGMALAAIERGHSYIAITDHSKALTMVRGLDESRLRKQAKTIEKANDKLGDRIRILRGIEVDILKDGSLDLKADALGELDVVVASVHSSFALPRGEMTKRVTRAIESGLIDILAHPTGRLLLKRDPFEIDMESVLASAKEHGVALEINAFPDRLDLSDTHCRLAKEIGVKVVISTDAHTPEHLDLLRYGLGNARRGWLEPADVINTLPVGRLLQELHEGHR
jgi:DNA polymerase (family 10)